MPMNQRPYRGDDLPRVAELLIAYRAAGYINRYPTLWRLKLLIDSRLWEPERDASIWEDAAARIVGFAMLIRRQPQTASFGLERVIHPDIDHAELVPEQLSWALNRAHDATTSLNSPGEVSALPLEMNMDQDVVQLENAGFVRYQEGHNVYMGCDLTGSIPVLDLPAGFSFHRLTEDDVEAYNRLYGFTPISAGHRLELIHHPDYCHLVVKTAENRFVGYLECSFSREEWQKSQRRIGWIDYIGTDSEFQGRGLAKALLCAGLNYLKDKGADEARLLTSSSNQTAQRLYEGVGMSVVETELGYIKNVGRAALS
jgi:ribosomal protein S18 acetylase RimI-like enzyme